MTSRIAYSGWIGCRNIGDEAIFLATKKLFPDYQFIDASNFTDYDVLVHGGGTVFPHYISRNYYEKNNIFEASIGVGVRDPSFWNQKFSLLDIGYYFGRMGYPDLVRNPYLGCLMLPLTKISDGIRIRNDFMTNNDFKLLKEAKLDFIGCRGPQSARLLSKYGIESNIVGDTALYLQPEKYYCKSKKKELR